MPRAFSFSPWVSLAAGFLLQFLAGTPYLFGVYAGDLRSLFGVSQSQVQLLGTLLNIGTWVGFTGGFLLDRIGRVYTLVLGSCLMYLGYFILYCAAAGVAAGPDASFYPLWCLMCFLAGQGVAYFSLIALKVNIRNFSPSQRGQVVGILQAAFGLSGGVFSIVRSAFFSTDVAGLLLFLSLACPVLGLLVGMAVNATPHLSWSQVTVERHFPLRVKLLYVLCVTVAIYVFLVAVFKPLLTHNAVVGLACGGVAIVFSVALLPIQTGPWVVRTVAEAPPIVSVERETSEEALLIKSAAPEMTLLGLLKSFDFYLLFFVYLCGVGPSIAVVNNMFSIVMSKSFSVVPLGGPFLNMMFPEASLPNRQDVTTFVALFSSVNTLGRLGFGFLSDRLQTRVSRPFWLVISIGTLMGCNLGFMGTNLPGFYPLMIAMGLAYGGLFAVVPSVVADSYGEKNFGLFYGILVMAPAFGSLLFSTLTAGGLADKFAADNFIAVIGGDGDVTRQCIGPNCYLFSFVTFVCCQAVALVAALVLWRKQR